MAHDTPLSRRAALAISAAALAGTAVSLPSAIIAAPKPAGAEANAILIEAWTKYQEALAHNATLNARIKPLWDELWTSHPHIGKEAYLRLSEEEQEAYRKQRLLDLGEASDNSGLTALQEEQDRLFKTVIDPLKIMLCEAAPTTLEGAAIKAALIRDYLGPSFLQASKPEDLDWEERTLHQFIEQLAALSGSLPGRAS